MRPVQTCDDVEERRLPGAVRADQSHDLTRCDLERDVIDGDDAAEALGHVLHREERHPREYPNRIHPTALKVQERLHERGLAVEVRELAGSTRTAADAAAAVGCEVGQIVKSLVFRRGDELVMCLCAGDRQVDTARLGLQRADADAVREATGFAIGGVPPLGHDRPLPTLVDASLRRFGTVWCAGGTPRAVFEVETGRLLAVVAGDEFE